jgi:hypothetical protein
VQRPCGKNTQNGRVKEGNGKRGVLKRDRETACRWLTPVILATQETEIRRIEVQSQPRQIVHETLSGKNPSQKKKKKGTEMDK